MSFGGLQERLTALQETTSQLRELVERLADLKFQPGSVPLDTSEEGSVSGELGAEIGQLLRDGEDERELLEEEVEYLRCDAHEKTRLLEGLERQGRDLDRCRLDFRKARLAAKKSLTQAQRLERELLVQNYSMPVSEATSPVPGEEKILQQPTTQHIPRSSQRHNYSNLSEKDKQAVSASHRVTDSLRQMHASLQGELERSEYAKQTLKESSTTFQQLNESYSSLDNMLSSSKDLIGTLMKSHKSDTWYLTTTMYMLFVTTGWLVFRRWLYGPLWWLVWLPLRLVFGVGSRAGSAVLSGAGSESGRVEVGGTDGKVPVKGLPNQDLPTAQVGQEKVVETPAHEPGSLIEEVGKLVEEADALGNIPEDFVVVEDSNTGGHQEHVEAERPRDEL